MSQVHRAAATATLVGESPCWDSRTRDIVWVDFGSSAALSFNTDSGNVRVTQLDTTLSAIMAGLDGRLIGIAADTVCVVELATGSTSPLASMAHLGADCRLNDATIDPTGRVWCGSMHYALLSGRGELMSVDATGSVRTVADGFGVCNGLGFSPDYRKLYLVDTLHRTLISFDCDIEAGTVRRPRIVTDFLAVAGKPDGLAVASDGGIWVAMWGGNRVVRVELDGRISREVVLPAKQISSCCFAGVDDSTLYVSTSRLRMTGSELEELPWSGSLLAVEL